MNIYHMSLFYSICDNELGNDGLLKSGFMLAFKIILYDTASHQVDRALSQKETSWRIQMADATSSDLSYLSGSRMNGWLLITYLFIATIQVCIWHTNMGQIRRLSTLNVTSYLAMGHVFFSPCGSSARSFSLPNSVILSLAAYMLTWLDVVCNILVTKNLQLPYPGLDRPLTHYPCFSFAL